VAAEKAASSRGRYDLVGGVDAAAAAYRRTVLEAEKGDDRRGERGEDGETGEDGEGR
jgi:hypothetical protein